MTASSLRVRPAAVAGAFYPGSRDRLAATVRGLLETVDAPPASDAPLRALIVPHAGYVYSGPIAATAYDRIDPARVRRVLLLGPSHRAPLFGLAVSSADAFATPLGIVPVDTEARRALVVSGLATVDDRAHALEHSLEVQLPFLQAVLPGVPVLPVAVGVAPAEVVADAIDALWTPDTLVVVSSDLSHYEPYESARRHDARTATAITGLTPEAIDDQDACGSFAVRGLLSSARKHGLVARVLDLRNSGDTAGDRDRVVGYGAFAVEETA
ncbi:MAG: AmmeMemoRadiSam system protein B [Acidimicrobiia bacterium]